MSKKTDDFIRVVSNLARHEYLTRDKWILPSVCISQGALESGWNLDSKMMFGIKGAGKWVDTTEYYNGVETHIKDEFRQYEDVAGCVRGYYDFLRDTPRYINALNNMDPLDTVSKLIHTTDGYPYATDPKYIEKIMKIINDYKLTKYDELILDDKPSEDNGGQYIVVKGDTLWSIARLFNTTVGEIVALNNIKNPKLIYAGQVFKIPQYVEKPIEPPKEEPQKVTHIYTVVKGDSLWEISRKFNTTVDKIATDNGITNTNLIYVGQKLVIN